ncbi:MAG: ABC transporter ATP-binding protein [bacterium]
MTSTPGLAITTSQLSRKFGPHRAVCDLNLDVPRGSVYGFLGLNGAGKSTTIRMLMGLLSATSGSASVLGFDSAADDIDVKRHTGYVPDVPMFYEWMTARETLAFAAHYRKGQWDARRAECLLKVFQVPAQQKMSALSKGMRAKISLILALAFNPALLILDEPVGGLDPVARRQFIEGVLAEYMDGERTIFISSHMINEIAGLVDHVGILHKGQLIRSQTAEELLRGLKRVRLFFDGEAMKAYSCGGLVRFRADGREAQLIIDGFDPQKTPAELARMGAAQIAVEDLSLEDAFIEIVGGGSPDETE